MKQIHSAITLYALSMYLFCVAEHKIVAPVSVGELYDKITILEIKKEKIIDDVKQKNIQFELESLKDTLDKSKIVTPDIITQLESLSTQLFEVNSKLWDIENCTRAKEAQKTYDQEFIELARSVYINNRERHRLKREINEISGSEIMEEKQYTEFQ